jgi:superfamily II DNA or RNA helicase
MKKAVLSDRIYMNFSEELYELIKLACTYKIPSKIPGDPPTIRKNYIVLENKFIVIPIGKQYLIPDDYTIVDNRVLNPVKFPEFKFELRKSQQEVYDEVKDNCLINADVSWGKTFTAIAIAKKLGQKTLIITHTVPLRTQWEKEIQKTLGIKPGIIGSGLLDYKRHPIVVANVQTLRKHIKTLRQEFGTVILDEVHHAPATIFTESLEGMRARYKIGLSATLRRKDYLHIVIPDYFSKTVFRPPSENQMKPEVLIVKTDIPFSSNNMIPWANRVNELVDRPEYRELVQTLANVHADKGHKVLVVSDRTEFLEDMHNRTLDRSVLVTGSTKDRDEQHRLLREDECDILWGAISIYKEGISENYLSCLILATPVNNDPMLKQLIGRILRKWPNKLTPLIIDIALKGTTAKKQAATRAGRYSRKRYMIKLLDLA